MQPLGTLEFYFCISAAVVLPLIILSELRPSRPIRSTTAYFRRERSKLP